MSSQREGLFEQDEHPPRRPGPSPEAADHQAGDEVQVWTQRYGWVRGGGGDVVKVLPGGYVSARTSQDAMARVYAPAHVRTAPVAVA